MTYDVLLTGDLRADDLADAADVASFASIREYDDRADLLADAARFDAVVARTFEVDAEFLAAAENLQVVVKHGVGLDAIDIGAATAEGVLVCNTPGANAPAVAEHAVALLLSVYRRLPRQHRETRRGEWNREAYELRELRGDTLGVFGCGNIGRRTARAAEAFGMDALAYDPYVDGLPDSVARAGSKADLFDTADAVSIHAPLTDETRGAVGREEFDRLEGGVLVNTARGQIVDEDALIAALSAGRLDGAGLDTFAEEPPGNSPLFDLDSVVVTPHTAGGTVEATRAKSEQAAAHLRAVHEGHVPESAVNADAVQV